MKYVGTKFNRLEHSTFNRKSMQARSINVTVLSTEKS